MLIFEVENTTGQVDSGKLMALTQFLSGRANDTDSKKQISTQAFSKILRAKYLGLRVR